MKSTWHCRICSRDVATSHLKRHLAAHDRAGTPATVTNAEWLAYLRAKVAR